MSDFSPEQLHRVLSDLPGTSSPRKLCIALSGGVDSVVLLHALAGLRYQQPDWQVRAVHINHQLQKDSDLWAQQCVDWCAQLQVPCTVLTVQVIDIRKQGIEAAARTARYAALQTELQPDEILLTAHHADDQLETVLMALMRGAGLDGLAAMPRMVRFGSAWHARPLLGFTREILQVWAKQQRLSYLTDPTNAQTQFDRNYLRHEIIPRLKQRWPAAAATGARAAEHLAEAQQLMDAYVAQDCSQALTANALSLDALRNWNSARRRAVIRYWLQRNEVLMPSTKVLQTLENDMFNSAEDRVPCAGWGNCVIHRYRHRLYLETFRQPEQLDDCLSWHWQAPLQLPHQLGSLCLTSADDGASLRLNGSSLPTPLTIRFRQGGERLRLPGESFHRELKKLMNDAGVLPWWRGRIPLLYAGNELVAVAGLWVSAEFVATGTQPALQLQWSRHQKPFFAVG